MCYLPGLAGDQKQSSTHICMNTYAFRHTGRHGLHSQTLSYCHRVKNKTQQPAEELKRNSCSILQRSHAQVRQSVISLVFFFFFSRSRSEMVDLRVHLVRNAVSVIVAALLPAFYQYFT